MIKMVLQEKSVIDSQLTENQKKITEEEVGFWFKRKECGTSVRFGTANEIKVLFLEQSIGNAHEPKQ